MKKLEPFVIDHITERMSMAARNDYTPYAPIDYSYGMLCAGVEARQPQFLIERINPDLPAAQLVLKMEFSQNPLDMKSFCDEEEHRMMVDPRKLRHDQV
jgi:hypothetical protein